MNKNQIRKALCEVESILQKSKEVTAFAFIDETENDSIFHIKEVIYYQNGKCADREFDIKADSAENASEIYHRDYAPKECTDLIVFLCDFGE